MDILYVSFEPLNSGSSVATCSNMILYGLIELGHNVEVLTIKRNNYRNYPYNEKIVNSCKMSYIGEYSTEVSDSNTVNNANRFRSHQAIKKSVIEYGKQVYRKFSVYNYTYFYLKNITQNVVSQNHYNIIISASDPVTSHKAVIRLKKLGIDCDRWIQHWGDPLAADINKRCIWPRSILRIIEKNILKKCDQIIYVSPFTMDSQRKTFRFLERKMKFVIPPSECNEQFKVAEQPILNIVYCGIYNSTIRNIIPLYKAVELNDNFNLIIAGTSDIELKERQNIKVLGQIPHSEAVAIERSSDVITCILNNTGTQIPAKAYYYVGTNKPILIVYEDQNKEIIDFLKTFNRFWFAHNDASSISSVLNEISKNRNATPSNVLSPKEVANRIIED